MQIDIRTIDIRKELSQYDPGESPIVVVTKYISQNQTVKPGAGVENLPPGRWLILQDQIPKQAADINWAIDDGKSQHVSIPMIEYKLQEDTPEQLALFGAQFSAYASWLADDKKPFERLLMLLSNVFSRSDGQTGYSVYAGLAIKQ